MAKTRKIALCGVLSAIALGIFVIESQIPVLVPIVGVKLGLANIITLVAMAILDRKSALCVFLTRVILGSMFAGSISSLLYSLVGGTLAFFVMCILIAIMPEHLIWVISVLSAIAHNAGQLVVAIWITGTSSLIIYAPILLISAIITGTFTGFGAMYLVRALKKMKL